MCVLLGKNCAVCSFFLHMDWPLCVLICVVELNAILCFDVGVEDSCSLLRQPSCVLSSKIAKVKRRQASRRPTKHGCRVSTELAFWQPARASLCELLWHWRSLLWAGFWKKKNVAVITQCRIILLVFDCFKFSFNPKSEFHFRLQCLFACAFCNVIICPAPGCTSFWQDSSGQELHAHTQTCSQWGLPNLVSQELKYLLANTDFETQTEF